MTDKDTTDKGDVDLSEWDDKDGGTDKSASKGDSYSTLADFMEAVYPDYRLETEIITTKDRYYIKSYQIRNEEAYDSQKGFVLFMHGAGMTPLSWLAAAGNPAPMIQMADLGYDVYMIANRGTEGYYGH